MPDRNERGRVNQAEKVRLLRAAINSFSQTRVVVDQLRDQGATWQVGNGLDMVFVDHDSLIGLNLVGYNNLVGIKIVADSASVSEERRRLLDRDGSLEYLIRKQKANIALMTAERFYEWLAFYQQIEKEGLLDHLGSKAAELSGLEQMSMDYLREARLVLEKLITDNQEYLSQHGVVKIKPFGELDHTFLAADGKLCKIPLSWVKEVCQNDQIGVEVVHAEKEVIGIMLPKEGETKREFEARCQQIENNYKQQHGVEIVVARGTPGQINLWRKLGFGEQRTAFVDGAKITPGDLIRLLYLGSSNLSPGPLAMKLSPGQIDRGDRLSLPGLGEEFSFPGVDLVFLRRANGHMNYALLNFIAALDPRQDRKGKFGTIPLNDVIGIKIFPDDWTFDQMKSDPLTQEAIRQLRRYTLNPSGQVVFMNSGLFNEWIKNESPFKPKVNGEFEGDIRRAIEYGVGFPSGSKRVARLGIIQPRPQIGGIKIYEAVDQLDGRGATESRIMTMMDFGFGFDDGPIGFSKLGGRESTVSGVRRRFLEGEAPMVAGIYDLDKLLKSANDFPALADLASIKHLPVASFLAAELSKRVSADELRRLLPTAIAEGIIKFGPQFQAEWGSGRVAVAGLIISHAHTDHIGLVPLLDPGIPIYLSHDQGAALDHWTNKAASWDSRMSDASLLMEPRVGNSYKRVERDIRTHFNSGVRVPLFSSGKDEGQVFIQYRVNHSLGSDMTLLETALGGEKVTMLYTGDFKAGEDTDSATHKIATQHRPRVIITETTNIGNHKPGEGKTELDVRDSIMSAVKETGNGAVVVVSDPRNLERIYHLHEVAEATGRKLAIGYPHAEFQRQMVIARDMAPEGAIGFKYVLPGEFGSDWTLWAKSMERRRRYQNDLLSIAGRGTIGELDMTRHGYDSDKWLVVVSPYDKLEDQFMNYYSKGMAIVYSASFPYAQDQKYMVGANLGNREWLNQVGVSRVYMDMRISGQGGRVEQKLMDPNRVYHVSGHVSEKQLIGYLDTLIGTGGGEPVQLVALHGLAPELAESLFYKKFGKKRIKVISQITRYNPSDPANTVFEMDLTGSNRFHESKRVR